MVPAQSTDDDDGCNGPEGPHVVPAGATSDFCGTADASSSKKRSREEYQSSQKDNAENNKKSKVDGVSEVEGVSELDVLSESTVAVDAWSNWVPPKSQNQKRPLSASPSSKDTAETSEATTETQATTVRAEFEPENVDPAVNMTPPMSPSVVACKSGHLLSCPVPRAPPSVEHEAIQQLEIEAKQLGSGWL